MIKPIIPRIIRRRPAVNFGEIPGTLAAPPKAKPTKMRIFGFGPDAYIEEEQPADESGLAFVRDALATHPVVWVDIIGLADVDFLGALGDEVGLHRLALEDVLNITHRPKIEHFEDVDFLIARMASRVEDRLDLEQVSLFIARGETREHELVISLQERVGDCFEPIRERIRNGRGRVRTGKADYLGYVLLDSMVDASYPMLAMISDDLDALDAKIAEHVGPDIARQIHAIRRELLALRRALWPLREAIHSWLSAETSILEPETVPYVRDCADHVVQLVDYVESNRELCTALADLHDSRVNGRMNEVMMVLTIMSSIFIPLGFLAGLYGMNFNPELPGNMPETQWPYAYFMVLGLMATIGLGMLAFFRRRRWI